MTIVTLAVAVGLALVHLLASRLRFTKAVPRSRWLSFAGGISVAYVFVHILPELAEYQESLDTSGNGLIAALDNHIYLVALIGLVVFYGLERVVRGSGGSPKEQSESDGRQGGSIFWMHVISFSIYNLLIGYLLLHRAESGTFSLVLFGVAMGFHFLVNDYGLEQEHRAIYSHTARWILAVAVLLGWLAGTTFDVGGGAIGVLFALLGGSIILNVLKEELPEDRASRFMPFALGATAYTAVLLAA